MLSLAIEAKRNMSSKVLDVDSAFMLSPNTYMEFPPGLKKLPGKALLFLHSINETEQGDHDWYITLREVLFDIGFKSCVLEPCLYVKWKSELLTLIAVFVNDIRIIPDDDEELSNVESK